MSDELQIIFNNDDVLFANLEFSTPIPREKFNNQIKCDQFDQNFILILDKFDTSKKLSNEYKKYNDKILFYITFMQELKDFHDEFLEINLYSLNKNIGRKKKVLVTEQSVYDCKYIIKTSENFLIFTNYN